MVGEWVKLLNYGRTKVYDKAWSVQPSVDHNLVEKVKNS